MPFGLAEGRPQLRSTDVSTRRLEAFSDGVFAIAITLLALTLEVPELDIITPFKLAEALAAKWPTYLSFLLSFVTLLIAWVYHHRLLQGTHGAGTRLLFANGILLLVVSTVPFPTALLGAFLTTAAASVACAIYAIYIGVLNLTYNVLWWEVERPQRQTQRSGWRPPTSMTLSYLGFPCYVVAAGLAFWRPIVTLIICGGLWVVWTIKAPMFTADSERDTSNVGEPGDERQR
jgi:uncharacterized membrane protein